MGDVRVVEKDVLAVARLIVALLPGGKLIAVTREPRQFRRDGRKKKRTGKLLVSRVKKIALLTRWRLDSRCVRERKGKLVSRPGCVFHSGCETAAGIKIPVKDWRRKNKTWREIGSGGMEVHRLPRVEETLSKSDTCSNRLYFTWCILA